MNGCLSQGGTCVGCLAVAVVVAGQCSRFYRSSHQGMGAGVLLEVV